MSDIQGILNRRDLETLYGQVGDNEEEQLKQIKSFEEKKTEETKLMEDLKSKKKTTEEVLKCKLTNFTLKLGMQIHVYKYVFKILS